jgi:hypothetical protein
MTPYNNPGCVAVAPSVRTEPDPALKLIVQGRPRPIGRSGFLDRHGQRIGIPLHRGPKQCRAITSRDIVSVLSRASANVDNGSSPIDGFDHAGECGGGAGARQ